VLLDSRELTRNVACTPVKRKQESLVTVGALQTVLSVLSLLLLQQFRDPAFLELPFSANITRGISYLCVGRSKDYASGAANQL
jgi:hypothetical protein